LDGTNVVSRADKVCVITDIGLDHTEILGDTIDQIAAQKAGIIQPGNHVIMHQQSAEVMQVIEAVVQRRGGTLQLAENLDAPKELPVFQRRNWSLAMAVFDYLQKRDKLPSLPADAAWRVATQTPPGRWEVYEYGDKTIILDGAHNPQKLQALCDSLTNYGITSVALLANLVEAPETKIKAALAVLQPLSARLIIPDFAAGQDLKSRHSIDGARLRQYAIETGFTHIEQQLDLSAALQSLMRSPEKVLVITGSLYLISAVRPLVLALLRSKSV
jgi:dihydrofolate synthase/folylpolyglutamate synthase